ILQPLLTVNTVLKEADLFCPNSVRINFTIYLLCRNELACKNSFLLRDDLFIIPSLKSCLRNQLTSNFS
ncbi:hypothetical protein E5289_17580, partial [Lactiplantibacillus pentosus]